MDEAQATERVRQDLIRITAYLEEQTGLSSRWNGTVELLYDSRLQGQKPFACSIRVHAGLVDHPVRWRTLIHEALHALSVDCTRDAYRNLPGWEEGVVERLQRMYRPALLRWLNLDIDNGVFAAQEAAHLFNRYIDALEALRQAIGPAESEFYRDLLQTPLADRPGFVLGLGRAHFGTRYAADYLPLFARSGAVLKAGAPFGASGD